MKPPRENRSFFDHCVLAAKGFCMGASDVVPGVSGGTMALILGIYEDLIGAVRSFDLAGLKFLLRLDIRGFLDHVSYRFLLAVGTGIVIAVFSLARALDWLLQHQPVPLWSFFFGLILASIIIVGRRVENWTPSKWISLGIGAVGAYFLVGLVPVSTPDKAWFLFLCGAIAICAMILPGISGSFMLVLLGKYEFALQAVNHRDIYSLAILAAGAAAGIVLFSRLLGWLLNRHHDVTVSLLAGLMVGSLRKIWPWKETLATIKDSHGRLVPLIQANRFPEQWGLEVAVAVLLMVSGFLLVILIHKIGERYG